ncbi:serine/threonine-protein kinase [Sorangium sp. So ce131]|uniref:serine/threonine-protein kinase n=1 Tax=Sorangium sp. So ce131 TaxID=3133282 RepID=UPI003F63DD52
MALEEGDGPTRVMSDTERQAALAAVRGAAVPQSAVETVRPPPPPPGNAGAVPQSAVETVRPPPAPAVSASASASATATPVVPAVLPVSAAAMQVGTADTVRPPPSVGGATGEGPLEPDPLVGTTVAGAYVVTRLLGEGGMGRVYETQHTRIPGKRFALKTLHADLAQHPTVLARFQREAEAVASVRSPHIVEIFDVNRLSDGRPCIITEYLEGQGLGDLLAAAPGGRLPAGAAVRLARQVCDGLAAAHALGIVHRDIKPENIFLTGDPACPTVKILDFGISKTSEPSALTRTGMVLGTPAYMPPEQAKGEQTDLRTDVYAVGAVLYHALTGQRPFERKDPTSLLLAVMTEEPRPLRALAPEVPPGLEIVVQRAMAKDPSARHPSMSELARDLAPYEEAAAPAPPPSARATLARSSVVLGRPYALSHALGLPASAASEAYLTRQMVFLSASLGLGWLGAGLVSSLAGLARAARSDAGALSGQGAALLTFGILCALFGVGLLGGFYVFRHIWRDDARLSALAPRLSTPVVLALVAYGAASLLVRFLEAVVLQRAIGIAWPVWDALLFFISVGAAIAAAAYQHWREPR